MKNLQIIEEKDQVVKEMAQLLETNLQEEISISQPWAITHYVSITAYLTLLGTSVGEGTFGKVKLGKHIFCSFDGAW